MPSYHLLTYLRIMLHHDNLTVPLLMAYAEIHFRFFPLFPSLLFKREPEIVFDIPGRLDPGKDLPIILILNDVQRFPTTVLDVTVAVFTKSKQQRLFNFTNLQNYELDHSFQTQLRAFVFVIQRHELPEEDVFINATLSIRKGRKRKIILNDNLFSSSKLPFTCRISTISLPGNGLCVYGDLHNHSVYSQSHVEYGPPLDIFDLMADTSGLSFLAITDHSYDLACKKENYLVQDQSLMKWNTFGEEFNKIFRTTMIQGEEISCLNSKGNVVHLCGIGIHDFIPGTLDGARKERKFFQQLTISKAVEEIHKQGGIAFAAHPGSLAGLLQNLFLHRGVWSQEDMGEYLDGVQALNSGYNKSWERGKSLWINMLQRGIRVPVLAGNDAHGDFNRYRAISVPFLRIYEGFQRFMGYGKTGIYGRNRSAKEILNRIRNGSTFISTGPYVSINYNLSPQSSAISTRDIAHNTNELYIHALSTAEFGYIEKVTLITGKQGSKQEKTVLVRHYPQTTYEINETFSLSDIERPCYLRAEVESRKETDVFKAFSSACWLESSDSKS